MKRFPSLSRSAIPLFFALFLAPPLLANWEPEVRLTFNSANSYTSGNNAHCIGSDSVGILHVVWYDDRDGNYRIFYKRSTDQGVTWSQDTCLTNSPDTSKYPSLAVSGSTIHVAWERYSGWDDEIYYKRSTNSGLTWSPDVQLTNAVNESQNPSISSWGPFVNVVWHDNRDFNFEIYYKRSTNGGTTWSPDRRLTYTTEAQKYPCVSSSDSVIHVVWQNDLWHVIYYKHSLDGGVTWDTVNTQLSPGSRENPSVSVLGSNVNVGFRAFVNSRFQVDYKYSSDNGFTWSSDTCLSIGYEYGYDPSFFLSGPNVHVVWMSGWMSGGDVFHRRSTNRGMSWLPITQLDNDPHWSGLPSVTIYGNSVHVIFSDNRVGNYEIYYMRNLTGNETVEEEPKAVFSVGEPDFKVQPNPFVSSVLIPGYERESFALYDISGRLVGKYPGSRVGANASPGVYFLKPLSSNAKPLRIVKLR